MGLLIGVGDFGIGDLVQKSQDLYDLLLDLCGDSLDWENILNKPTTLAGFGITNVYTKAQVDAFLLQKAAANHTHTFDSLTSKPTTILGYGITNVFTKSEVTNLLTEKAEVEHTHIVADIIGLEERLIRAGFEIVEELPDPLLPKALYLVHGPGDARFRIFITTEGPDATAIEIDAVSYAFLATALASKQDKLDGEETDYVRGNGTYAPFNKAAIGLGNVPNLTAANFPISNATQAALNAKANDANVLHKTGNETKTSGVLTFAVSPQGPMPTSSADLVNKGYVDAGLEEVNLWNEGEEVDW